MSSGDARNGALPEEDRLDRIVDLFFESGMLRRIPRTGWAFLGSGAEDVAQHSFRVALMAFALARTAGADPCRAAVLGLFHDLHEARTSDLNYVNRRYVRKDEERAQADAVEGTGLEDDVMGAYLEFEGRRTPESLCAKDADQLDLLFNLRVEQRGGSPSAADWMETARRRLSTPEAKAVAERLAEADPDRWWRRGVRRDWWVEGLPEEDGKG